jgi:nicotinate-nucleotide adenylyltransferase
VKRPEIAVFGGSFDPPHVGHVLIVSYALSVSEVDEVLIVPTYAHAFGKVLTAFDHRLRMCELAFRDLARVRIDPIERDLGGESRTLRLVEALIERYPHHDLRLLIGADIMQEAHKWHSFDRIVELARPLVAGRGGHPHPDVPKDAPLLPEVSSTQVRRLLAAGEDASAQVPARVLRYIREHGLYAAEPPA